MSNKILKKLPTLFDFQTSAKDRLKECLYSHRGSMLIAKVGYGKTFVYGQLIYELLKEGFLFKRFTSPYRAMIITKARAKEKAKRDMARWGLGFPEVLVTNFDALRSSQGEVWIEEYTVVRNGEPEIKFKWRDPIVPTLVVIDECHALKNPDSLQSRIVTGLHNVPDVKTICVSATPISRVSEARYFALLCGALVEYGYSNESNVDRAWGAFSAEIAGNTDPTEFSPTAMQRLSTVFSPYIVRIPHIRSKFKSHNSVTLCEFIDDASKLRYMQAYVEYLTKLESIDREAPGGIAAIWVANLMFRIAAGKERAPITARAMYAAWKGGKASIAAVNFRCEVALIVEELVKLGVDRKKIALIWGGIHSEEDVYDLDLGPQSPRERQKDIDDFQLGKKEFCIFTYKAGGCALSLHHCDDHDGMEVKSSKPREVFLDVAYSVFEVSQGVGRAHRITSLSDTYQTFLLFKGTIEEEVALKLSAKLQSLGTFIQSNETWYDILSAGRATGLDNKNAVLTDEQQEELESVYVNNESESSGDTEPEESLQLASRS